MITMSVSSIEYAKHQTKMRNAKKENVRGIYPFAYFINSFGLFFIWLL